MLTSGSHEVGFAHYKSQNVHIEILVSILAFFKILFQSLSVSLTYLWQTSIKII